LGEVQYVESLEHPKILTKLWRNCHTFHKTISYILEINVYWKSHLYSKCFVL
jgi:hypothetical protein